MYDTKIGQQIPSESAWETVLDFESHEVMAWMVCYDFCDFSSHAIHGEISLSKKDIKKTSPFRQKQPIWTCRYFGWHVDVPFTLVVRTPCILHPVLFLEVWAGTSKRDIQHLWSSPWHDLFVLGGYLCNVNIILQEVKCTWRSSYVLVYMGSLLTNLAAAF